MIKKRKSRQKVMISPTLIDRGDYEPDVWIRGDYNPYRGIFRLDLNDVIKKSSSGGKGNERNG